MKDYPPPKQITEYVNRHRVSTFTREEIEELILSCPDKELIKKLLYILRYVDFEGCEVTIIR